RSALPRCVPSIQWIQSDRSIVAGSWASQFGGVAVRRRGLHSGPKTATPASRSLHVEAEHHSALVVLGNVAVRHPGSRIRDVEQDVHGLAGSDEHSVPPNEIRLAQLHTRTKM